MKLLPLAMLLAAAPSSRADGDGSWAPHSTMNAPRQEVGAARIGDTVYVVGGLVGVNPWTATDSVERLDLTTGTWSFVAPLPASRDHMMVAAAGGKLYVAGGFDGDFSPKSQLWVYDPAQDTWSTLAPLPAPRGAAWMVALEGKLYLIGGSGTNGTKRTTFIYDIALDAWSTGTLMPTAREHLNAEVLGDRIHVVGGRNGPSTGAHEAYRPETDTWEVLAPMPTPRSAIALAAWGGRLYAMGGEVPVLSAANESYDPGTNSWATGPAMPLPRHGIAAVTLDQSILCPAGGVVQGFAPSATVDRFLPDPCPGWWTLCECLANAPCGNVAAAGEGCANSTGAGGRITATGTPELSLDDLVLTADGLPPGSIGLFAIGELGPRVPVGDGLLCLQGTVLRLSPQLTGVGGTMSEGPGLSAIVAHHGLTITPGQTWVFQAWFRDPLGPCGTTSNLSSALAVTFVP